ncbi:AraC family transcriptional regulator [Ectobacillus ponti]|uniref:AraC family transcriptional regulator n=1 Tax=Ectobacillus ponti TaxID=2961894 RepID=A0AA41X2J2_9BACI|nr:AraC family transcriptional regulator [Ectobacillus ponti]
MDLLQELMQITEEEQAILQKQEVKQELYTSKEQFIIEIDKLLSRDQMIMVRKHTRFVDFPLHKHDYIELNYVYHGQLHQTVGGKQITLQQGELLLLNQHIEHEIEACANEDIIINFLIRMEFFDFIFSYIAAENIVSNFLLNSLYNHTHNGQFLYFKVAEVTEIQELLHKMIREILQPSLFSESAIKLYMGLFMIELIKHTDKLQHQGELSRRHTLVVETFQYIEEHFREASLSELARQLNQTHYGLSKQIKKATGHTFKELLQEKRLDKAKELLEGTNLPIASVAEQTGYDNISYFYRIFKSKYGQTPKELRDHAK